MSKRNVFLAMGFEPEDAMILAVRSDLADAIAKVLQRDGLRQADAADLLGLPQGVVSNIVRGRIDHLSIERLMKAMVRANIPGYAKWPTADTAKAGVLHHSVVSPTISADLEFLDHVDPWAIGIGGDFHPEPETH
jgi:Uncharacterized conserved small protein|nr:XRE family transcriptional regulator [uncultured Steroidobacter sp.]